MGIIELLIFVFVFVAILGGYHLGTSERFGRPAEVKEIRQAETMLEYRNATGFTTLRKVRFLGYAHRRGGRSCLFALCNNGTQPRTFRVDRIVSIATLDGEVLDTRQFLTETLGVPV